MTFKNKFMGIALLLTMPATSMAVELGEATSFNDAITGGQLSGNLRLRHEFVNQDGKSNTANALTLRSVVGYQTKPLNGFSVNAQVYGVSPIVDNYNDAKKGRPRPGRTKYPVVADPEDYDFHQLYVQWADKNNTVKFGRQNIFLDNWRYIGDVRFRQNWAVFNGISLVNTSLANTKVTLAHFEQIKQVTTKLVDIKTEFININHRLTPTTNLIGYGYFVEWEDNPIRELTSTKTIGMRFDGKQELQDKLSVLYTAEYAKQSDYKDADRDIDNDYYRIGAGLGYGHWFLRLDQEKLSAADSGSTYAFNTPFGTNHLFQGWADVYLNTPKEGIKDTMLIAGAKLLGATIKAEYHWIASDNHFTTPTGTADERGTEFDIGIYYQLKNNVMVSAEYANFKEDAIDVSARKRDIEKLWLTAIYKF